MAWPSRGCSLPTGLRAESKVLCVYARPLKWQRRENCDNGVFLEAPVQTFEGNVVVYQILGRDDVLW